MARVPTDAEINAQAVTLGLADENGKALQSHRSAIANTLMSQAEAPAEPVEDLHDVVIRFDQKLYDGKVDKFVRAAAVGALVHNLTQTGVEYINEK